MRRLAVGIAVGLAAMVPASASAVSVQTTQNTGEYLIKHRIGHHSGTVKYQARMVTLDGLSELCANMEFQRRNERGRWGPRYGIGSCTADSETKKARKITLGIPLRHFKKGTRIVAWTYEGTQEFGRLVLYPQ